METVNSELRIGKLGCFSAARGICSIVHMWRLENEPQVIGRPRPLFAISNSFGHWTLATGNWYLAAQPRPRLIRRRREAILTQQTRGET
jgi:hypothetical protein